MKKIKDPRIIPCWWTGMQFECSNCKAIYEIEIGDDVRSFNLGATSAILECPNCDTETVIFKQNKLES